MFKVKTHGMQPDVFMESQQQKKYKQTKTLEDLPNQTAGILLEKNKMPIDHSVYQQ
jgi:hypothetical protein